MCAWANPMFLLVDNSDSPSVVEQLQQGCSSNCFTFISDHSWLYDMSYALCLSASFLQHGYIQICFLFLFYDLMFPVSFVLIPLLFLVSLFFSITPTLPSCLNWGSAAPFYPGYFLLDPGIACLTMCTLG